MEPKLQEKLETITEDFQALGSWTMRYQHLVDLGRGLDPMKTDEKNEHTLVKGCLSPVWLSVCKDGGVFYFSGDSDAVVPKGLTALVVNLFSGLSAQEVLSWQGDLAQILDLKANLSPTRAQALGNLIQRAQDLVHEALLP